MSIVITKKLIQSLNPCQSRYENYLKFYGDKELTVAQFMGRKNITQSDKMWVAFRLMKKEDIRMVAADIAESVLHLFEDKYPNDKRVREAIEAARNTKLTLGEIKSAANAAANAAYAAAYAAYAAAYAADTAANAAYAAANAAYAAANAVAYAAANAAAYAADAADAAYAAYAYAADKEAARKAKEKAIRKIVMRYLRNV